MKKYKFENEIRRFTLEIILIFASVLIFRSLWNLLDKYSIFNTVPALLLMLSTGIAVTIIAFDRLFHIGKR